MSALDSALSSRWSRRRFAASMIGLTADLVVARAAGQAPPEAISQGAGALLEQLSRWLQAQGGRLSASVMEAGSGRELAQCDSHQTLNPASNQKILTTAVALLHLGPDFRFQTSLHGRANGDSLSELVLRSDGNPEFTLNDLEGLVRTLWDSGCRRIDGDIWVDQSAFDSLWSPPAYDLHPNEWAAYRAPVSAVALDENTVTLHVLPSAPKSAARFWFSPPGIVEAKGRIEVGPQGKDHDVRLTLRAETDELKALVGGTAPAFHSELRFTRRVQNPELVPGRALLALLRERRIAVSGIVRSGAANINAELASVRSRPLSELLFALGKHSDNFVAEMLLKAVGAKVNGQPGSSAAGATAVQDHLAALGALDAGTKISNGSGLYDANRLSAFSLAKALVAAYGDSRIGPELLACLSIGGVDGTLSQRFSAHRQSRAIRAKTGTLADSIALSGYVLRAQPLPPVAFALLINGSTLRLPETRRRMDAVVEALVKAG